MYTCHDIANYFLSLQDEESGDTISNLKLQKLVYYAQGFSLVLFGRPLFNEPIEAWVHGPVVPDLYRQYNAHGGGAIPVPENFDIDIFDRETKEFLDEVYSVYGQYSAWKLRNMTHEEAPWRDAETLGEISHQSMRDYFSTLIEKD